MSLVSNNITFKRGLVLVELIVAVIIIGLLTTLAFMNMSGLVGKSQFQEKTHKLINIMQMACESAARSDTKYEIIFDPAEQTYQVLEMSLDEDKEFPDDNIIETGEFTDNFFLSYVQFDDFDYTEKEAAIFRVGLAGYQFGGKIVIFNENGEPYSIVVSRINCRVEIVQGDVELLIPRDSDELPF